MRIELRPDVQAREGVPVGLLDGRPLVYHGRIPHVAGEPYRQVEIAPALAEAVDVAASAVFGGEWSTSLGRVTGLNRRTCGRDRIERYGIPAWVLVLLGKAASHDCPRALGYALLAVAELNDRGPFTTHGTLTWHETHPRYRVDMETVARLMLEQAMELVSSARDERGKHRGGQQDDDTNS